MKRLISLILVMLMSTSAVFASSFSDADIKKIQDNKVSYFTYLGSHYLRTTEITQISTTGTGDSRVTVYSLQKGTDDPAFRFTLTGLDKFEIEFVDDKEELELDITKALVLSSFRWFAFFEMVNTLPNNMLQISQHTKVYAVMLSSSDTLQYFVTRTDYSSYKHHIVLMRETGLYGS